MSREVENIRPMLPVGDGPRHLEVWVVEWVSAQEADVVGLTCVPTDRAGEVGVYLTCQPVVAKGIAGDAPRAKILSRQHAPCSHDPHECVEGRQFGILSTR